MTAFPKTESDLLAQGYKRKQVKNCNGPTCNQRIEWWETPKGKKIPLNQGTLEPHWATCKDVEYFRKKG